MLIEGGADPNKRNHCDETPLMLANHSAHFNSICDLLLAAGADINSRDRAGRTILWRQIGTMPKVQDDGQDSHDDIQFLLDHGADPTLKDFRGRTLLHESIKQRPASFHSRTGEDDTRIPRLDFLLNLGLDHTVVDYNGNSLLHEFAARESSTYPYTRDWVMILWKRLVCSLGLDTDQKNVSVLASPGVLIIQNGTLLSIALFSIWVALPFMFSAMHTLGLANFGLVANPSLSTFSSSI